MREIASYVPTTTWRGRLWGIVGLVVPSALGVRDRDDQLATAGHQVVGTTVGAHHSVQRAQSGAARAPLDAAW